MEIYYSLTDTQIAWLDEMFKRQRKKLEYDREMLKKYAKLKKYRGYR